MADTRERWEVERDDFESGKSGKDIEDELELRLDSIEDDDEDESEDEEAETDGADAELVTNFPDAYEAEKASAEADSAAFRATVEENLPDYQPPAEALSMYEEAAVAAAKFPPGSPEFEWLKKEMQDANEALRVKMRSGTEGFDAEGAPVIEPFDPSGLDSAAFNQFMQAVASGGASPDPRRIPAGESYESWSKKVNSALGRS